MASIRRAQVPVLKQTLPKCPDHNEDVVMVCGKCNNVFVCVKCVTTTHEGHSFKQISEIASTIKEEMLKTIVETAKSQLSPRIFKVTDAYMNLKRKNAVTKQETLTQMKNRVTEMKRKLDQELEKMETEIENEYKTKEKSIEGKIKEYKESSSKLNCLITDCESLINSRDSVYIISKSREKEVEWKNIRSLGAHSVDVSLQLLHLEHTELSDIQVMNTIGKKQSCPVELIEELELPQDSLKAAISKRVKVQGHNHKYVCSLAVLKTDLIWILFSQRDLLLIDTNGSVLQDITIEEGVADITATQSNMLLVACFDNRFRTIDVDGHLSVISTTQTGIWDIEDEDVERLAGIHSHYINHVNSICTDKFDNVYATINWHEMGHRSAGKVGVYFNLVDKNECTNVTFERHSYPQHFCPFRVSIDNNSGDICMLQMLYTTGKTNVVLCDWEWRVKAKFTVGGDSQENYTFTDVCFDAKGNLIVSDSSSGSLFVINRQNYNMQRLKIDKRKPHGLCIMSDGKILVGCEDGSLLFMNVPTVNC